MKKLMCPMCESTKIEQYRSPMGKIWCNDCLFSVENKEINNPFIREIKKENGDKK